MCIGELLVAKAKLFGATKLEILNDYVGLLNELACKPLSFGGSQIQGHRLLVAVDTVEICGLGCTNSQPPIARVITADGVFNLDNLGAKVAKNHGTGRARQNA
ncbi:hypothetical protein CBM2599_B51044 [Cupriavidus taiwanensis]|nr:hypothetical protein CBM2599_B51044 [Cupriavidus taiwanensis]SOZ00021.1 hypothetical protein CBM2600_B70054 [Cupriavidus taiwanensis]